MRRLIVVAAAVGLLSGCGGERTTAPSSPAQQRAERECATLAIETARRHGSDARLEHAVGTTVQAYDRWELERWPEGPRAEPGLAATVPPDTHLSHCVYEGDFGQERGPPSVMELRSPGRYRFLVLHVVDGTVLEPRTLAPALSPHVLGPTGTPAAP